MHQPFRNEREKYAKHRHKAEHTPAKYLSVIIDGMDQDKTDIPHIISNPKALVGNQTLETHITGVKVHGRLTLMAIDCGQFKHDSNLTLEVLMRVMMELKVNITCVHVCFTECTMTLIPKCRKTLCLLCCTSKWIIPAVTTRISTTSHLLLCW